MALKKTVIQWIFTGYPLRLFLVCHRQSFTVWINPPFAFVARTTEPPPGIHAHTPANCTMTTAPKHPPSLHQALPFRVGEVGRLH